MMLFITSVQNMTDLKAWSALSKHAVTKVLEHKVATVAIAVFSVLMYIGFRLYTNYKINQEKIVESNKNLKMDTELAELVERNDTEEVD